MGFIGGKRKACLFYLKTKPQNKFCDIEKSFNLHLTDSSTIGIS